MTLRIIGAGLGRTGTHSLKLALEKLLGAPCHHMLEVILHPSQGPTWLAAAKGERVDWRSFLSGYAAAVDWPAAAFWPELAETFPDAPILLSWREPEKWWESASETIFVGDGPPIERGKELMETMMASRFTPDFRDREAAIAAFVRHNQRVRELVPAERLIVWTPSDGWDPICRALGVPIPDEPFPKSNTREEWFARAAAQASAQKQS